MGVSLTGEDSSRAGGMLVLLVHLGVISGHTSQCSESWRKGLPVPTQPHQTAHSGAVSASMEKPGGRSGSGRFSLAEPVAALSLIELEMPPWLLVCVWDLRGKGVLILEHSKVLVSTTLPSAPPARLGLGLGIRGSGHLGWGRAAWGHRAVQEMVGAHPLLCAPAHRTPPWPSALSVPSPRSRVVHAGSPRGLRSSHSGSEPGT